MVRDPTHSGPGERNQAVVDTKHAHTHTALDFSFTFSGTMFAVIGTCTDCHLCFASHA